MESLQPLVTWDTIPRKEILLWASLSNLCPAPSFPLLPSCRTRCQLRVAGAAVRVRMCSKFIVRGWARGSVGHRGFSSLLHRSARWHAPTRRGACCGFWKRRRWCQGPPRTPSWSGFSPTMAPRRVTKKVLVSPGGLLCFLSRGPTYMGLEGTAWKGSLSPWAFLGPVP